MIHPLLEERAGVRTNHPSDSIEVFSPPFGRKKYNQIPGSTTKYRQIPVKREKELFFRKPAQRQTWSSQSNRVKPVKDTWTGLTG
jgi:hypothetical protein